MAIVEAGNMTAAAEFLHITQPTLSKQMKILERMYGTRLLIAERGKRSMHLTEAGKVLYQRVKQICLWENMAINEVHAVLQEVRGALRFSISQGRSAQFIKSVLAGFYERYPKVHFELYEGIVTTQQEQLLSGMTDLGICNTELTLPERFEVLFTREEEIMLVAKEDFFGFPSQSYVTIDDIRNLPIAISGGLAGMLEREYGELNRVLDIVCISTTKGSTLAWATTGQVVAMIPAESDEFIPEGYRSVRLRYHEPIRKTIVRPIDRPLSYVAKVFLQYYKNMRPESIPEKSCWQISENRQGDEKERCEKRIR